MTVDRISIKSVSVDDLGDLCVEPIVGVPITIPAEVDFEIGGEVVSPCDVPPWAAQHLPAGVDVIISRSGDEIVAVNFVAQGP